MSKRAGLSATQRPKPIPVTQLLEDVSASTTCHSIITSILDDIINRGVSLLHQHEMERCAMKKTAEQAVYLSLQAVEWQLLPHDMGEKLAGRGITAPKVTSTSVKLTTSTSTSTSITSKLRELLIEEQEKNIVDEKPATTTTTTTTGSMWTAESEPPRCDLDRWARGAIPIKPWTPSRFREFVASRGGHTNITSGSNTPILSPILRRPSSTGNTRRTHSWDRNMERRVGSADSTTNKKGRGLGLPSRVLEDEPDEETAAAIAAAALIPRPLDITLTPERIEHEKWRLNEMKKLERKSKTRQKQEQMKQAERLEAERYEKLTQELRGRHYTLDPVTAQIIFIQPLKPEKMPNISHVPHLTIRDGDITAEEEAASLATRAGRIRARSKGASLNTSIKEESKEEKTNETKERVRTIHDRAALGLRTKKPKPKPRPVDEFIDTGAVQPPIIQTVQLAPGVTLRQGTHVKSGVSTTEKLKSSSVAASSAIEYGLTRSQYLTLIRERKSITQDVTISRAATAWQQGIGHTTTINGNDGIKPTRAEWEHDSQDGETTTTHDDVEPHDHDMQQTTQTMSREWSNGDLSETAPFPIHHTRTTRTPNPILDTMNDFNASILADASWGNHHGDPQQVHLKKHPMPNKPSSTDRLLTVGRRARLPRDRPYIEHPIQRQHLPAPSYPAVTGHGGFIHVNKSQRASPFPSSPNSPSRAHVVATGMSPVSVTSTIVASSPTSAPVPVAAV